MSLIKKIHIVFKLGSDEQTSQLGEHRRTTTSQQTTNRQTNKSRISLCQSTKTNKLCASLMPVENPNLNGWIRMINEKDKERYFY